MVEPPPAPDESEEPEGTPNPRPLMSLAMLALVAPASILGAISGAASFLVQTEDALGAARMSVMVAALAVAEALGSAAAVRLSATPRALWMLTAAGVPMVVAGLAWTAALVPAAIALSACAGLAGPLRATAIQHAAADAWRARTASAASMCDMLLSSIVLPLAGYRAT
jgi:hypothetical protein